MQPIIIQHAAWLYLRFILSYRDVEGLLAKRGVIVSDETIRRWCGKFARTLAGRLRQCRPKPDDRWHLDEVFIRIIGVQHYLWRAVDQDGIVLGVLVRSRCNTRVQALLQETAEGLAVCAGSWSPIS